MSGGSSGFPPTEEQEQILQGARAPESRMIQSYAGTGKSTTLEMLSREIKVPGLALAFNAKNAKVLQAKLPGNFLSKTLNGLGHGAWARGIGKSQLTLDDRKLGKIVTQLAKDSKIQLIDDQWQQVLAVAKAAMQAGLSPGDEGSPLVADTPETWSLLADDQLINSAEKDGAIDLARQALVESIKQARQGLVSFDDQIYCPTILGGSWTKFPVVLVDEAQDLSPLNHKMLGLSLAASGKLVAVGDSKQAIYAFRGASSKSMAAIERLRPSWLQRRLTLTFRCPRVIVARQQDHAPGFRAHASNQEGKFFSFLTPKGDSPHPWSWKEIQILADGHDIAVLCRNNGPLLAMAFKLLRQQIGVVMLGRDLGKNLIGLTKKLAKEDNASVVQLLGALASWEDRETALARANDAEAKVAGIQDRADCIRAVAESTECETAGQLRELLRQLFDRESGQVTISSVHRAKGLEWNTVVHLDPWRIPSKQARKAQDSGDPEPMQQELNLRYVAETRAKQTLINAALADFQSEGD